MKKYGFTIIELVISIAILGFLLLSIAVIYLSSTQAMLDSQARARDRSRLSSALDLMSRELRLAQSVTVCNSTTLTFAANLGSGLSQYSYSISGTNLLGTTGAVIAADVQNSSVLCTWTSNSNQLILSLTTNSNSTTQHTGENVTMATTVSPVNPVVYGLVGWWNLSDGTVGTTCSGAVVSDASGNGNTGTCYNSPTWVTGMSGSVALNFNGTSQYVQASGSGSLNLAAGNAVTMCGWMNSNRGSAGTYVAWQPIVSKRSGGSIVFFLAFYPAQLAVCTSGGGGSQTLAYNSIPAGQWTHMCGVISPGVTSSYYINGVFLGTSPSTTGVIQASADPFQIGFDNNGGSDYFSGSIEDVRVYNRALSASEIEQIYAARL